MPKCLSRADIERIAGTAVEKYYRQFPSAGLLPEPVDPVKMAEQVMGLEVNYLPICPDRSILGIACFEETAIDIEDSDGLRSEILLNGRDILIDDSLLGIEKTGRRNFTTAHEIAHHALVRMYPDNRDSFRCRMHVYYKALSRSRDWDEWQADTMAAAMLMPEDTIRQCLEVFGVGNGTKYSYYPGREKEYSRFCDIAHYLGVSRKALAIRMKHLGIINENQLAALLGLQEAKGGAHKWYARHRTEK